MKPIPKLMVACVALPLLVLLAGCGSIARDLSQGLSAFGLPEARLTATVTSTKVEPEARPPASATSLASPTASNSPTPVATGTRLPSPSPTTTPSPTPAPATATEVPSPTPVTPTTTPLPPLPAALQLVMDTIAAEVASLRGLDQTEPLSRALMSEQDLYDYVEYELKADYSPEEVEADVRVLAAFDFVPRSFDLEGVLGQMYSTQVLGLYDDEEDVLYVVTDNDAAEGDLNIVSRITVAHEYTHALQDEHFSLETFIDDELLNDDQILARLSLVEGDATLTMTEWLLSHQHELTRQDIDDLQASGGEDNPDIPAILQETFGFPYERGLIFVTELYERGWQAVDFAYADPPSSTEQILHPEKYLEGDEPQMVSLPPLTGTLDAGWELVESDVLGEFQTRLYLAQQVSPAAAAMASEGWDGDRYAVYANDQADLLIFSTVWDTPADRAEFVDAYRDYAQGRYGERATRSEEAELWWELEGETAVLAWTGSGALVLLAPTTDLAERVLAELP